MKHSLRFGQGSRVEASVNPQSGKRSTTFYLNAVKFDAGTIVQVEILDPQGRTIYRNSILTDAQGSIGYAGLRFATQSDSILGEYTFTVSGKSKGKNEKTAKYFAVT